MSCEDLIKLIGGYTGTRAPVSTFLRMPEIFKTKYQPIAIVRKLPDRRRMADRMQFQGVKTPSSLWTCYIRTHLTIRMQVNEYFFLPPKAITKGGGALRLLGFRVGLRHL